MKGIPFLFVLYLATISRALEVPEKDLAQDLFSRPLHSVTACHSVTSQCTKCFQTCSNYRPFFDYSYGNLDIPSDLFECRVNMSHHRMGVATWCQNDDTEFFATSDFQPNNKNCEMDVSTCTRNMMKLYETKNKKEGMKKYHPQYRLAQKLKYAGELYEQLKEKEEWYEETKQKHNQLAQWYQEDIVKEMDKHLNDPVNSNTRFSDPVYKAAKEMNTKIKETKEYIDGMDLDGAIKDTVETRKVTAQEIDRHLRSIRRLENRIKSKKKETDKYLSDIKKLVTKTHDAQREATHFSFETTHASGLDTELNRLNRRLMKGMDTLRKEKLVLSKEMNKAAQEKVKLVQRIREMIEVITQHQKRNKCGLGDFFGF